MGGTMPWWLSELPNFRTIAGGVHRSNHDTLKEAKAFANWHERMTGEVVEIQRMDWEEEHYRPID